MCDPLECEARLKYEPAKGGIRRVCPAPQILERNTRDRTPAYPNSARLQLPHGQRHLAKIDLDGAGYAALMTGGAVIGDVLQFPEMRERTHFRGLRVVEDRLRDLPDGKDLVPGIVQHSCRGDMGAADGLALSAPDACRDVLGKILQVGGLEDIGLQFEQAERGSVHKMVREVPHQFARVEEVVGILCVFVLPVGGQDAVVDELQLRQADAVFSRHDAAEPDGLVDRGSGGGFGLLQHGVVAGKDGYVHVDVPVSRVHVRCDDDLSPLLFRRDALDLRGKFIVAVELGTQGAQDVGLR